MADEQNDALLNESGETSVDRAIARAREKIDEFDNVVLNIAVTGGTGAGKSSLVNALRGVRDTEEGAAKVGETETTTECAMYPHPAMPNVRIWDLPGIGTERFKAGRYIKDVKFQNYDSFILVCEKRFKENDTKLAKEILKKKKNFYFVRSGIDQDVENAETRHVAEEDTLQVIRKECQEHLKELGPPPVFLISSMYPERYDFQELQNALEKDLPDLKRNALVLSLPVYSLQALEKKYKIFQKAVWALAVLSGGIGVAPVPGLSPACDLGIVVSFFSKCYFSFGLDDASLTKLGDRVNEPIRQIVRESSLVMAIANKSFLSTKMAARLGAAGVIEGLCLLVPVAGNIAAAGVSFVTTRSVLKEGLDELYSVAKQVIEMAGLK